MSNVATVQSIYQCFGTGDIPGILARLRPDVEWEHDHEDHGIPWLQPRRGHEGVVAFFQTLGGNLEFLQFAPEAFLSDEHHVAVFVRHQLRVRATGRTFSGVEIHYWTFDAEGRVARMKHFVDTASQLAALRG